MNLYIVTYKLYTAPETEEPSKKFVRAKDEFQARRTVENLLDQKVAILDVVCISYSQ